MMESFANYNKEKQKLFPDKETQNISYKTKEIKDFQKAATIKPQQIEQSFTVVLDKGERHRKSEVHTRIPRAALVTQAENPSKEEEQKLWEMFKQLSKQPDFAQKL